MEPVPDPDITLTSGSKEETYEPAEDDHMDVAQMCYVFFNYLGTPELSS